MNRIVQQLSFNRFVLRNHSSLTEIVAKLRSSTGLSLAMCQKAAKESSLNYDIALKSLNRIAVEESKQSAKTGNEGILAISGNFEQLKLVKLNCDSDFVAMSPEIIELASNAALQDVSSQEAVNYCRAKFKENIEINTEMFNADKSQVLGHYIHQKINSVVGKAIGIVTVNYDNSHVEVAQNLASLLAKQLVACRNDQLSIPEFLQIEYFFEPIGTVEHLVEKFCRETRSQFSIATIFSIRI